MALRTYIAGPMRGIPRYNFPAFDAAAAQLRAMGLDIINPAELDRAEGVNEDTDPLPPNFLRHAMKRDLAAICDCDAIALLPGWEKSKGVKVELALANLLRLRIIMLPEANKAVDESLVGPTALPLRHLDAAP